MKLSYRKERKEVIIRCEQTLEMINEYRRHVIENDPLNDWSLETIYNDKIKIKRIIGHTYSCRRKEFKELLQGYHATIISTYVDYCNKNKFYEAKN